MRNSCRTMGDFGASTRAISFAPQVKSGKEQALKKFREKLGRKGYSPAEAALMAAKVRSDANALAAEINARQGNDDPVKMAGYHMIALKMKISDALKAAPTKAMGDDGMLGRISKTSPMSVSVADRGRTLDTHAVNKRARKRDNKREAVVEQAYKLRKSRGKLKDDILREAMRASYVQQFNGGLGHYYGGQMGKWKKPAILKKVQKAAAKVASPVQKVAAKVAAPVKQAAQFTAKSAVRGAKILKKDPIGALTKLTIAAPFEVIGALAPKGSKLEKAAFKASEGTAKGVKVVAGWLQKILEGIKNLVIKALKPVVDFFKKAWELVKKNIIDKVAARFTGKGTAGFGSLPEDEKKKITELTTNFVGKKALEAAGVEATILGSAAATGTATATATVTTAAAVAGPGAPAAAAAAVTPAVTAAAASATPTATAATTAYITKLTGEGVNDVGAEFAKYKAAKAIPNPIVRQVVNAGIAGKIPTDPKSVAEMAKGLPEKAGQELVKKVNAAPQAMKEEIIKKALVPQEFKKVVEFQSKEAHILAAGKPAIPQVAIAQAMQKAYAKDPKVKEISPAQAKEEALKGVIVQDQLAVDMAKEGKLNMTQAIVASSPIGKQAAIEKLPPEVRAQAVAEVKKEMSNTEVARIEDKAQAEKAQKNTAVLTAAAIAAKVLLF